MDEAYFFEREFELRFLKSRGTAFQELFSEIMERAYPGDFQRVRPYGNTGDLKCDGYLTSERVVFQVYGPEDALPLRRLLQKVKDDFNGAVQHWAKRMDRWVFVHNRRTGLPAQVVQIFDDMRKQPNVPLIEIWGYEELRQILHQISADALRSLFPSQMNRAHPHIKGMLPHPRAIKQYWTWMRSNVQALVTAPHLAMLQRLDLPTRLIPPEEMHQWRTSEEYAVAQSVKDTRSGIWAQDDGSFEKGNRLGARNISEVLRIHRHLLIVGDSGSGKSTLLRRFAKHEVKRLRATGVTKAKRQTPVLVELWRFGPDRSLSDLVIGSVKRSGADISGNEIFTAVERGYVILLLDGLDDVSRKYRRECLAEIISFVEQYPGSPIALTTRPFPNPPDQFHRLEIAPLTDANIATALRIQFGSGRVFQERFGTHFTPKDYVRFMRPEVRQLCRAPLTLGLVLALLAHKGELPNSLYGSYDRFLSWILDWEVKKGHLSSAAATAAAIEETAYVLVSLEQMSLPNADWVRKAGRTVRELRSTNIVMETSAEEILHVLLSTGLLCDQGGEVSFSHRSFLEFLAARRLLGTSRQAQKDPVALHLGVARFLIGGMDDGTPLLEEHLLQCDDVQALMPLLSEASRVGCLRGRFEMLYDAIALGQEMAIELSYSPADPETEATFTEDIGRLVQACVDFKPKALSVLKDAADGIVRANHWEHSRLWFERILTGLEEYGWPGATLHRQFAAIGIFESIDAFSDDGTDPNATERVEEFFAYLAAVYEDNFPKAAQHLAKVEELLHEEIASSSHPSIDDRTLKLPFFEPEMN